MTVLIYPEVEEVTVKPRVLKIDRGPHKLKIDPITNRIFIANKNSNTILVIDGQTEFVFWSEEHGKYKI